MFLTFFPVCKLPVGADRSRDTWGRTLSLQKKNKKHTHTTEAYSAFNISDVCFFQHVRLGSRTAAAAGCELAEPRSSWRDVAVRTGDTKSPEVSPAKAIFSHSLRADGSSCCSPTSACRPSVGLSVSAAATQQKRKKTTAPATSKLAFYCLWLQGRYNCWGAKAEKREGDRKRASLVLL